MTTPAGIPECAICLTEVLPVEVQETTTCNHVFHRPCIARWIRDHNTCPTCRNENPIALPQEAQQQAEAIAAYFMTYLAHQIPLNLACIQLYIRVVLPELIEMAQLSQIYFKRLG
jgi:hypothetical protein